MAVWDADDAGEGGGVGGGGEGGIIDLRNWLDRLAVSGPSYGYFTNASKTWRLINQY